MFRRLGLINKHQRGFTLIELLVAIAIVGVIVAAAATGIFQVITGNARSTNHMVAVRQVQNAGYWVSHDTQMAQSVNATGPSLILTWVGVEEDGTTTDNIITYTLTNGNLVRIGSISGQAVDAVVAQYLTAATCNFTGGVLALSVTATVGSGSQARSETRKYEIVPRPSS